MALAVVAGTVVHVGDGARPSTKSHFDMAMTKVFPLKENRFFEVRMSATNVFNHPEYTAIDTVVNSPTFGRVISVGAMRTVLMTARFRFWTVMTNSELVLRRAMTLVVAAALLCPNLAPAQQTGYTFKAEAELVLVNISVRDRDGNLVSKQLVELCVVPLTFVGLCSIRKMQKDLDRINGQSIKPEINT